MPYLKRPGTANAIVENWSDAPRHGYGHTEAGFCGRLRIGTLTAAGGRAWRGGRGNGAVVVTLKLPLGVSALFAHHRRYQRRQATTAGLANYALMDQIGPRF